MRLSPAAIVVLLLSLALILPGCGDEPTTAAERATTPKGEASGIPQGGRCRAQLRAFVGSMDALREKLAVGLSYADYLREVRRVKAVYAQVPVERLTLACLTSAGAPGERALNRYLDAANAWGGCLTEASCEIGTVEPKLQRRWRLASHSLSEAQSGLRRPGFG